MSEEADQREFLLRSLEDLEREHDAGDLDDADYAALKDDYTARAAAVLRAERATGGSPRRRGQRGFVALAGVAIALARWRRRSRSSPSDADRALVEGALRDR